MESRITAFPDGNSFVAVDALSLALVVGNSNGLAKIFAQPEQSDLEPSSVDIQENITSISVREHALITTTSGKLESASLAAGLAGSSGAAFELFRSELPLRDAVYINEGKRVVTGGDDSNLVVIDLQSQPYQVTRIPVDQSIVSIAYTPTGEMIAVSLLNGKVVIYSVANETLSVLDVITGCLREKINTSMDELDFVDEHMAEHFSTRPRWSVPTGEHLIVPHDAKVLQVFNRASWKTAEYTIGELDSDIVDYCLSPDGKLVAIVDKAHQLNVYPFSGQAKGSDPVASLDLALTSSSKIPLNICWCKSDIYIGTTNGDIIAVRGVAPAESSSEAPKAQSDAHKLFLDEAEDSDADEEANADDIFDDDLADKDLNGLFDVEDSMVIDEDDDDQHTRKRLRRSPPVANGRHRNGTSSLGAYATTHGTIEPRSRLSPFSPGSTPWSSDKSSTTSRRYLAINSFGYTWAVKSESTNQQQSITVSFFDRAINKDYHFTDYNKFDVCSMNARGVLLGVSGADKSTTAAGKIFYRHHESLQDSWEHKIPLLKGEFIMSLTLTDKSDADEIIVVGTNYGYLRFFNLYGVCIYLMKSTPVVSIIASGPVVFVVNEVSGGLSYTYSVLNIAEDYRYIQQDITLPLLHPNGGQLIKGIFFNENNDPCLVGGHDDTLIILSNWREVNNGKWIPILNLDDCITEGGQNVSKKHWKSWPLGLYKDQVSVLILKSGNQHPGFPLPLPVEVSIKLPMKSRQPKKVSTTEDDDDTGDLGGDKDAESEDPAETFLRAATMGRIVHSSLQDIDDEDDGDKNDELVERLQTYSMTFDKSLLKIFAQACQDAQLSRAYSVAKLIKTDKALFAASKIAERMEYLSLAQRIAKLREDLLDEA